MDEKECDRLTSGKKEPLLVGVPESVVQDFLNMHPKEQIFLTREVMDKLIPMLKHARIFITSRQKMNPVGVDQYDEMLAFLKSL